MALKIKSVTTQIVFRYRPQDSSSGLTRATTKCLATELGVGETQVIHLALYELATKFLPQYNADNGPLTKTQMSQLEKSLPKPKGGVARSCLFELENM